MKREHQINLWYFVVAFLAILLIEDALTQRRSVNEIAYSEFQKFAAADKIGDIVVGPTRITGTFKEPKGGAPKQFSTIRVDPALADRLVKDNTTFSGEPEPGFVAEALTWLVPMLAFVLIWVFLIRRMNLGPSDGLMGIGRSKAKVYVEKDVKVTFADVAGVDEAIDELKEIVAFLKDPQGYGRLGARVPKGVLLVGPPGTGKTLLARAVAGEAGVPFFSISGSEFVEMFVGIGAARVRDLFQQAHQHAPAIVFIDELDALGRARGAMFPSGAHDEKEQTLNQLLSELDGFDTASGVVLLAATNRPEILDPALLRAGRFDRQILVDRPDRKGRIAILRVHLKKVKIAADVVIDDLAGLTPGFTGADLANLVNEAALLATRRSGENVAAADFVAAVERIVAGLEKRNRVLNAHERKVVAYHEMGHALIAMSLPGADPVQKVSIIPRGIGGLGYTIQRPTEDRFLMDRGELMNRMTVLLGGRAAEALCFEEVSTGAGDDLAKATEIARSMVGRFGMDTRLGPVAYEPEQSTLLPTPHGIALPRWYGEKTATAIDDAVRGLVAAAFERASSILGASRPLLERTAGELLAKETLSGEELRQIKTSLLPPAAPPRELVPAQAALGWAEVMPGPAEPLRVFSDAGRRAGTGEQS